MNNIFIYIKKFFAIIISIFYGLIKKDKDEEANFKSKDYKEKHNKYKTSRQHKEFSFDDDSASKGTIQRNNSDQNKAIYYAKKDIQKLIGVQKNLINLEYEINICEDIEKLVFLENEVAKEKSKIESIKKDYEKIDIKHSVIKEIKDTISECSNIIKQEEKDIKKKITKLEKEEEQELEEEIKQEKLEDKNEVKEDHIDIEEDIEKNISNSLEQEEFEDEQEEIKKADLKEKNEASEILNKSEIASLITIKSINDIVSKDNRQSKNKKKKNEEKIAKKEQEDIQEEEIKLEEKDKKTIIVEKDNAEDIREYKVNKDKLIDNAKQIENNLLNKNLAEIKKIIAKAKTIMNKSNAFSMLQINPALAVTTSLYVNNAVRRARSHTGKKIRKLTLNKIMKLVGLNPALQVKAIMVNSLSEIRKLKLELKQYGNIPEAIAALNELNELELELLMQINELQNQNVYRQTRNR